MNAHTLKYADQGGGYYWYCSCGQAVSRGPQRTARQEHREHLREERLQEEKTALLRAWGAADMAQSRAESDFHRERSAESLERLTAAAKSYIEANRRLREWEAGHPEKPEEHIRKNEGKSRLLGEVSCAYCWEPLNDCAEYRVRYHRFNRNLGGGKPDPGISFAYTHVACPRGAATREENEG